MKKIIFSLLFFLCGSFGLFAVSAQGPKVREYVVVGGTAAQKNELKKTFKPAGFTKRKFKKTLINKSPAGMARVKKGDGKK